MTKSIKDQTTRAFQVGGYNPAAAVQSPYGQPAGVNPQTGVYQLPGTGIAGYQMPSGGTPTGYTPYGGAQPYFQPVQFTGPQFQTALQTTNLPTFAETVGNKPGQYDELKTYINDAGQTRQIPFKNGQPIYPIPEGYRLKTEEATTPTVEPTTGTGVRTGGGEGGDRDVGSTTTTGTGTATALSLGSLFGGLTSGGSVFGTSPGQAEPYKGTALSNLGAAGFSSTPSNSLAGQQAGVADALGVYGNEGINVGAIASILTGNVLGAIGSVSGIGPNTQIGAISAPAGFGAFTTEQLENYVTGKMSPVEMQATGIGAMNKSQALQRAQVQKAIRTPLTGQFGFSPGSIDPNTGQPYDAKGRLVNTNGSSTGVDPAFSDVGSWIDAVESSIESGYWGGPLTDAEYDNLSSSGKAKYDSKAEINGWESGGVSTGKGAEGRLGDPSKGGEVSATPGGTAGTPGSQGRADYSGGYRDNNDSARDSDDGPGSSEGSGQGSGSADGASDAGGFGGETGDHGVGGD